MIVRQLQYLVAVAREGHFGRAAVACRVSQPTLSAGIRRLEEELGLPLVIRSHRFLGLTEEGERVLTWARRMVADYDGLLQELAGTSAGLCGVLRVGAIASAMPTLTTLLNGFCQRHPQVRVQLLPLCAGDAQRRLDQRELDAVVTLGALDPLTRVRATALFEERYVFIDSSARQGRTRASMSWAEALEHPLCLLTPDTETRRIADGVWINLGLAARPRFEMGDISAVWAQVLRANAATVMPEAFLDLVALPPGISVLPLVEPVWRSTMGLFISDREPAAPLAAALLRFAQQNREPVPVRQDALSLAHA